MLSASRARPALRALAVLALAATTGCAAAPARELQDGAAAGSIAVPDLARLGHGTLYVVTGSGPARGELWRLDLDDGTAARLTRAARDGAVTTVSASRAGIVVSGRADGVPTTGVVTRHGVETLGGGGVLDAAVDRSGRVAAVRPADVAAPGGNGSDQLELAGLDASRPTVLYAAPGVRLGPVSWGPQGWLAVAARPAGTHRHGEVLVFDAAGVLARRLRPLGRGAPEAVWGPRAPGIAAGGSRARLLGLTGKQQPVPRGWRPLCWSPDGRGLLVARGRSVGLWRGAPTVATVPLEQGRVTSCAWLEEPAPVT